MESMLTISSVSRRSGVASSALRFYEERGTERGRIHAVVMVDVEQALPLVSPAYDDGSTEDAISLRSLNMYGLTRTSTAGTGSGSGGDPPT